MVVARLNAGVSVAQAQAEMNAMQQRLERDHPQENAGSGARLVPLRESLLFFYDAVRASLLALLVAVGLVLLIVCANLGSLLMARAAARAREIAVRAALGAGRLRLLQQLLVENGILALAGGVGGALAAAATLRAMRSALPEDLFRAGPLAVDATVLVVAGLASLLAAAVFGLAPARLALAASQEALADGSRGQAGTRHGARFHRLLIVGQLALAMTLLAGTAVALETFYNLQRVSLGFEARQVLTAELQLPESRYPSVAERSQFYEELMRRMRSVAGVEQAATVYPLPLNFESLSKEFTVEGRAPSADKLSANAFWVSTDYFATMRIPLLKGRSFTVADHSAAPRVAIVNQKMAEQYWPGQDPVGRQIRLRGRGGEMQLTTVIGVAGASKSFLVSDDPHAQLFVPMLQEPTRRRFLMIRAGGRAEPLTLAGAVRAEVHALDKTLPVSNVRSMTQVVAESMQLWTLPAAVMAGLGLAALALAVMGIYGFLSYAVATRTREIGVRVALGARRADIVRLILGQGLRLAGIGLAGGLALAIGLSRLARSMLFGVAALDPFAFVLTPLALAAVAALACAAPAWRAARLAPLEALRYE
jgi:predicted permease